MPSPEEAADHSAQPSSQPISRSISATAPSVSGSSSAVFLVARRLRAPLILLIAIYAVSILGLMLVPGVDADGAPAPPMDFFHAFYFISYTATTIGFGELPGVFSEAQRLWVTVVIYLSVVGWSYSVVAILALAQDKSLAHAMALARFSRRVRGLKEPFYLLCGGGSTGLEIARNLAAQNRQVVIVDHNEQRMQELDLEDLATNPPMLTGDVCDPATLVRAGLKNPFCQGVVAVTDDDQANLAVAISAQLLNPDFPVLARVTDPAIQINMAAFRTDHVINPYDEFALELRQAIASPEKLRLSELVTSIPGAPIRRPHRPPSGLWIVAGLGHFGQSICRELSAAGNEVVAVDPREVELESGPVSELRRITGRGTDPRVLAQAGIQEAVGLVAATDDDVENLSLLMTARQLNNGLFLVGRQNRLASSPLFESSPSNIDMVASKIVAEECVALLTTPLLHEFDTLISTEPDSWCAEVSERLTTLGEGMVPVFWEIDASPQAIALSNALSAGRHVRLSDLLNGSGRNGDDPHAVVLLSVRGVQRTLMPDPDSLIEAGDRLLFAGHSTARRNMLALVQNANLLEYILTGTEPAGWAWGKLSRLVQGHPEVRQPTGHR